MFQKLKSILSKHDESDYLIAFNKAINTTKMNRLGSFDKLKVTDVRLINNETVEKFYQNPVVSQIDPRELFSMCFHTHIQLQGIVNKIFKTESILTLGYVEFDTGKRFHYQSLNDVLDRINERNVLKEVNMHCWLTLPTSEIIDLTLPTTQAIIEGDNQKVGSIIMKYADELKGMKYVPQILGDKYLHLAGIYDKNIPRVM